MNKHLSLLPAKFLFLGLSLICGPMFVTHAGTPGRNFAGDKTRSPGDDCDCEDLPVLISRMNQVHAAFIALEGQIMKMFKEEDQTGKTLDYLPSSYPLWVTNWVNMAMDEAGVKTGYNGGRRLGVDPNCGPTIDLSSIPKCLLPFAEQNDDDWMQGCRDLRALENANLDPNWMYRNKLEDIAEIEVDTYLFEFIALNKKVHQLIDECKYSGWTGTVSVTATTGSSFDITLPRPGADPNRAKHGTETHNDKTTFYGVAYLIDGTASGAVDADWTVTDTEDWHGKRPCHSGARANILYDHTFSKTRTFNVSGSFFSNISVQVSSQDRTGQYKIYAIFPGGLGNGTDTTHQEMDGECPDISFDRTDVVLRKSLGGKTVTGIGTAPQNAREISGSSDCGKQPVIFMSASKLDTCTIKWNLRRTGGRN